MSFMLIAGNASAVADSGDFLFHRANCKRVAFQKVTVIQVLSPLSAQSRLGSRASTDDERSRPALPLTGHNLAKSIRCPTYTLNESC